MSSIEIGYLADHAEHIPALAEWFGKEWAAYYGEPNRGDATGDLEKSCNIDKLPVAFIALDEGSVCGTASLKQTSIDTSIDLSPWLATLFVLPEKRGRGIGGQLVNAAEDLAARLGHTVLYSGTSGNIFKKLGWYGKEDITYYGRDVTIYQKVPRRNST